MKKQILKIAGVKSEKEFYKKFPTEESFVAKHGKELKKAAMGAAMINKQPMALTDYTSLSEAQDGRVLRAANANLNFWEKCRMSSSADNRGSGRSGGGGSDKPSKYKNAYEEISDIKAYDKDERKAFEKSLPEGVEIADWVAMNRDASRMNALLRNPDYDKYTDEQGVLKPDYQSVATRFDPYYLYYKPAFVGKKELSPKDILEYQKSQPGGLAGYKELVNRGYKPEQKEYGGYINKAQIGSYIGGEKDAGYRPIAFQDIRDTVDYAITGSTEEKRKEDAYRKAELEAAQKQANNSGGGGLGDIAASIGQIGQIASAMGGAKKGKKITKLQAGPTSGLLSMPNPAQITPADTDISTQFYDEQVTPDISEIPGSDLAKQIGKYSPIAGQLIQGIQAAKAEKKALEKARQAKGVSDVALQASRTRPEETERKYLRPEQVVNTGEEFFPIYGVGTNVLARNGASVGGGEIMNTFAPNTLYDDLGYEPLNESERYKQFYHGGKMHKAQDGFLADFAGAGGGDAVSQLMTGITGRNAGGQIGGSIGQVAGTAIAGPVGGMIGKVGGQLIGTLVDRKPQKIKAAKEATQKNVDLMSLQQGIPGAQAQYTSFMKDGGMTTSPYEWVSHTWQPQVIASFGEHKVKDLLRPPADADMLRAGGHLKEYTAPSEEAMSTERPDFAMGGELQIHWGGKAEPMSYNPYLPEGGETVMFRGQSHDESDGKGNTGIGITYGDNPVEVERGEPAMKLRDGSTGDTSFLVFGNLKIPKGVLGDPDADDQNFKRYVADISEQEEKQNKLVDKSITAIDEMEVQTRFDRLKFNSLQAKVMGANMKLKDYAGKKMNAAALQTAMNDTIEEYGLKTTDKGNIMAKLGKTILKAQDGKKTKTLGKLEAMSDVPKQTKTGRYYGGVTDERVAQMKANNPWYNWEGFDPTDPSDIEGFQKAFNAKAEEQGVGSRLKIDKKLGQQTVSAKGLYEYKDLPGITITGKKKPTAVEEVEVTPYKRSVLIDILNQALPFVRPSDKEDLDPSQLYGEMFAMATNQLEPVKAQLFQPQLSVPYDISLQDILNENEASFRSQQRMFGYNPALQSQLNSQKYLANQKVLGEQFRMNQAMKNQIYKENRDILNQAKLQNLAILDQQYVRQEEAKSKTKATTQAALNSIASKYAQNQLENRTLQVYENLYNYRYDPNFRAINMNPLWQPNVQASSTAVRNGGKVNKKSLNGSIVKALKNI